MEEGRSGSNQTKQDRKGSEKEAWFNTDNGKTKSERDCKHDLSVMFSEFQPI